MEYPRPTSPFAPTHPGVTTIHPAHAPSSGKRDREFWSRVKCSLRGWVRAPDLVPGVHPGEARLAARGDVRRIAKWGVELVFKERTCFSAESDAVRALEAQRGVAFTRPYPGRQVHRLHVPEPVGEEPDDDDWTALYEIAERKTARGLERRVFSAWLPLPPPVEAPTQPEPVSLPAFGWETPAGPVIDTLQEFSIHVPDTNFPPVLQPRWWYDHPDPLVNVFSEAEAVYILHVLFDLDGEFFDVLVPAGNTAFVPAAEPLCASAGGTAWAWTLPAAPPAPTLADSLAVSWPQTADFAFHLGATRFAMRIHADPPFIQGRSAAFTVHLRRTAGTASPGWLKLAAGSETVHSWVREEVGSDAEYARLFWGPRSGGVGSGRHADTILALPSAEELRAEAEAEAAPRDTVDADRADPASNEVVHHFPSPRGESEWGFEMTVPFATKDAPTFAHTFTRTRSTLWIELGAVDDALWDPDADMELEAELELEDALGAAARDCPRDAEWGEYVRPRPGTLKFREGRNWEAYPDGWEVRAVEIPLGVVPPPGERGEHYTSGAALAPALTLPGGEARFENVSTALVESNFPYRVYGQARESGPWPGGGGMHAAKMWMRREMAARGVDAGYRVGEVFWASV